MFGNSTSVEFQVVLAMRDQFSRVVAGMRQEARGFAQDLRTWQPIGQAMTLGVTLPVLAAAGAITKIGIDAGETRNLVKVSFGAMAQDIEQWADRSSASIAQTRLETQRQAADFFNLAQAMKVPQDEAVEIAKTLTELGADFASFFNTSVAEANAAIRSGFSGESEPLKRFGVFLSETRLKQEALNQGIYDGTGILDNYQKALATLAIIQQDANKAVGDMERTSDSTSNRIKGLKARIEETAERLSPVLVDAADEALDAVEPLVERLGDMVEAFNDAPDAVQQTTLKLIAFGLAIPPIINGLAGIANSIKTLSALRLPPWLIPVAGGLAIVASENNRIRGEAMAAGGDLTITPVTTPFNGVAAGSQGGLSVVYGSGPSDRGAYAGTALEDSLASAAGADTKTLRRFVKSMKAKYGIADGDPEFNKLLRSMYPQLMTRTAGPPAATADPKDGGGAAPDLKYGFDQPGELRESLERLLTVVDRARGTAGTTRSLFATQRFAAFNRDQFRIDLHNAEARRLAAGGVPIGTMNLLGAMPEIPAPPEPDWLTLPINTALPPGTYERTAFGDDLRSIHRNDPMYRTTGQLSTAGSEALARIARGNRQRQNLAGRDAALQFGTALATGNGSQIAAGAVSAGLGLATANLSAAQAAGPVGLGLALAAAILPGLAGELGERRQLSEAKLLRIHVESVSQEASIAIGQGGASAAAGFLTAANAAGAQSLAMSGAA